MGDSIETIFLQVELQKNGIMRMPSTGIIIGRLSEDEEVSFEKLSKFKIEKKKVNGLDCCPICDTYGKDEDGQAGDFCPNCGQELDWEKLIDSPCKIGDKVKATVCRPYNGHEAYIHGEVVAIFEDKKIIRVLYSGCKIIDFYYTDFGKTVFVEEEK
jgi:hypothetical protein